MQPRTLWDSRATLSARPGSGESVVSSVATRLCSLAKCTPLPTFATRLAPAPRRQGTGARSGPPWICAQRLDLSFWNVMDPREWKAEAGTLSLGLFLRGREALALNLLDQTGDPVSPPTGCVTSSFLGLSFFFCKMALTLLP